MSRLNFLDIGGFMACDNGDEFRKELQVLVDRIVTEVSVVKGIVSIHTHDGKVLVLSGIDFCMRLDNVEE
jgi:hypothetical protein